MRQTVVVTMVISLSGLLQGCAGAIVAQAFPFAMGGLAMANVESSSPFTTYVPNARPRTQEELAALDRHIRQAECGDAPSQYWLAGALHNDFNTSPNTVEVYKWYRLAELGGYAPATQALGTLTDSMSDAEIADARARADRWQGTSEGCAVTGPDEAQDTADGLSMNEPSQVPLRNPEWHSRRAEHRDRRRNPRVVRLGSFDPLQPENNLGNVNEMAGTKAVKANATKIAA